MDGSPAPKPAKPPFSCRGMRFPRDPGIITGGVKRDLLNGEYERKEADIIVKNIKPEDTVLELGGGIGFISTLVATKCKPRAVHTFEANPRLIPYIQRVHAENGCEHVEVNNAILGPRKSSVPFYIRKNILASSMQQLPGRPGIETTEVDVRNARHEFKRIKPTVLICDIEGAEAHLMPSLPLDGLRAAILELHPQWIGPKGVNAVFKAFMDAGMAYYPRFSTQKVVCFRRAWHVT